MIRLNLASPPPWKPSQNERKRARSQAKALLHLERTGRDLRCGCGGMRRRQMRGARGSEGQKIVGFGSQCSGCYFRVYRKRAAAA